MTGARNNMTKAKARRLAIQTRVAELKSLPVAILCVAAFCSIAAVPRMNNAVRPMMPELPPAEPATPAKAPEPAPPAKAVEPPPPVKAPEPKPAPPTTPLAEAKPAASQPTPVVAQPAPAAESNELVATSQAAPAQPIAAARPAAVAPPAPKPLESAGLQLITPPKPLAGNPPTQLAAPISTEATGMPVTLASANLVAAPPELAGRPGLIREGDRTWLDNVPQLKWKKSGETSFLGALSAALRANPAEVGKKWLDIPTRDKFAAARDVDKYDYVSLMGDTGVAFRVRWLRYGPKPGSQWGITQAAAGDSEDLALLERRLARKFSPEGYFWPEKPDMSEYLPRIIDSIDVGRPVLAFGTNDETGVIVGYDRQAGNVLMRDYFSTGADPWIPTFQVGGYLCFIGPRTGRELSRKEAASVGLSAGVRNWARGPVGVHQLGMVWMNGAEKIHYGAGAYEEWMQDIASFDELQPAQQARLMTASAWNMNVLADARWAAAAYLRSVAGQFGENHTKLEKAAAMFAANATAMDKLIEERRAFVGPWHDKKVIDWTADMRLLEMEALKQFRAQDEKAINLVREAIK